MRLFFLYLLLFSSFSAVAQESDVIIMKNKKGHTVKVFGAGTFIRATSIYGHELNGFIIKIKNDSIYLSHGETRLVNMGLGGTMIDTFYNRQQHHYLELAKIDLAAKTQFGGRKKGTVLVENLLGIGSVGFIILETVNGIRSSQPFSSGNRWQSMGAAVGVYAISRGIRQIRLGKNNTTKYSFTYVKAESIQDILRSNKDN